MDFSIELFPNFIDAIPEHVAILDSSGTIVVVNKAWQGYTQSNGGDPTCTGIGSNYLAVCKSSSDGGNKDAQVVSTGLQNLINGDMDYFTYEYPCHSPTEQFWYLVKSWPFKWRDHFYLIVCHQNVTESTIIRETYRDQSLTDSLTGISNRRHFELFLTQEWRRDLRSQKPISLLLADIDYFKRYNDNYGHSAGDLCLKRIALAVQQFAKRPGDLAARLGGEEFVLLLGNTPRDASREIASRLLATISSLQIEHENSPVASRITVSIGAASIVPRQHLSEKVLVPLADEALYLAKRSGRNRVVMSDDSPSGFLQ